MLNIFLNEKCLQIAIWITWNLNRYFLEDTKTSLWIVHWINYKK